jgi:hypothetical protein
MFDLLRSRDGALAVGSDFKSKHKLETSYGERHDSSWGFDMQNRMQFAHKQSKDKYRFLL